MMQIALCDDESYLLDLLEDYFSKYEEEYDTTFQIFKCKDGISLLEYLKKTPDVDVIFLDIQLPGMNGIEAARKIRKINTKVKILFLTATLDFALEGYEVNAERYLVKPLEYAEFKKELQRIIKSLDLQKHKYFVEKNNKGIFKVFLSEILYIETVGRNTLIHTTQNTILSYRKMQDYEKVLDKTFFRSHRSFFVHLKYVKNLEKLDIFLTNGESVSLSKHKKKKFKDLLLKYFSEQID